MKKIDNGKLTLTLTNKKATVPKDDGYSMILKISSDYFKPRL